MKQTLWTKNFTIITIGTIISMFGSSVSNFAIGLLILDKTNSTFLYSLFFVAIMTPSVIVPLFAGPFIDRFSRRKMIYRLDFISFLSYAFIAALTYFDYFNYPLFLLIGVFCGTIFSIYQVTYDSFYPMLISQGNFSKAYSIGSLLYPLANTIMVPVAAIMYESIGLFPLFVFDALSYLIAAIAETQIKIKEEQVTSNQDAFHFKAELKEGITYLRNEKGLLSVSKYFAITMFSSGIVQTLLLPFFKSTPSLNTTQYSLVMSSQTLGRIVGGLIHYKIVYPAKQKYQIAVFVYTVLAGLDILFFFSPFKLMMMIYLVYGVLGVTSFNIRTSATQSYVPNKKRGRFNGIFSVVTMLGMVLGQLLAGILGECMYIPYIIVISGFINLVGVYFCIIKNKQAIQKVYNRVV
ncbi:MAG: MFS transporter [Erysipelotrichia bacterium]|nr:MFS transporter [Erysipelotrichia bacterium]NCC55314.1 MFS transporter [Erysipelotrichia bacterium]